MLGLRRAHISTRRSYAMRHSAARKFSRGAMRAALIAGSVLALSASSSLSAPAAQQVDLKLVLATDVSGSINDEEAELQRQGTADAFADPEVIKSIQGGALGRIAVAMLDFSSPEYDKVVLDWRIIRDKQSALQFSE